MDNCPADSAQGLTVQADKSAVTTTPPDPGVLGLGAAEAASSLLDGLLQEFRQVTGTDFELPAELRNQARRVLAKLDRAALLSSSVRQASIFGHINRKLRLNREAVARTYSFAAACGVTFNHNEKRSIEEAFDCGDFGAFQQVIGSKNLPEHTGERVLATFNTQSRDETLQLFAKECRETINPRLKRVDATMTATMLEAIFAGYLFSCFPIRSLHDALDPLPEGASYEEDFWRRLHLHRSHLFDRDNALWVLSLSQADLVRAGDYESLRERVCGVIRRAHARLNNHCFLALHVEPLLDGGRHAAWELAADVTLFAEKFL